MAGNAVIGALRVILGADTAEFDKGLKGAQSSLAAFGRDIAAVAGGISLERAISNVVHGLKSMATHALQQADEMGKMAQRIGIPVEELSKLRLAADLSGVSMEQVGVAVGRLSRAMSQIAGGKTNDTANAFKALGISVTGAGGALKTSTQVMEEVAEKFKGMNDGAGKTALAIAIFGRAGAAMIPMLNQGAEGLKEAREEAEKLGLVIDLKTAKAAEEFNDNMRRLRLSLEGVSLKVAAELAPALAVLTKHFVDLVKDGDLVKVGAEGILNAFFSMAEGVAITVVQFRAVGTELQALGQLMAAVGSVAKATAEVLRRPLSGASQQLSEAIDNLSKAWRGWEDTGAKILEDMNKARERFAGLRQEVQKLGEEFAKPPTARVDAPIIATENALDKFIKTQQKAIAGQRAEAETVGAVAGARESLRIILQGQSVAQENNIALTNSAREKLAALAGEARNAAMEQERMNIFIQNLTPWQAYQAEIQKLNALFDNGRLKGETYGRAMEAAADKAGISWQKQVPSIAGSFAEIANSFASQGNKLAKAAQVLSAFQALVSTYAGSAEALKLPFPFNIAASAAVLAKGLALVAAIKGFAAPKMASGGAMRMPGLPGGGVDSQLMVARVRPDEQVDVWRPGEGPDQRRGGGGVVQDITLNIPDRAVRELWRSGIEHINSLGADGYRLKVA